MSKNPTRTFPLTKSQFEAAVSRLQSAGIHISGIQGTVSYSGCNFEYHYYRDKETLSVTLTKLPVLVSANYVFSRLQKAMEQDS